MSHCLRYIVHHISTVAFPCIAMISRQNLMAPPTWLLVCIDTTPVCCQEGELAIVKVGGYGGSKGSPGLTVVTNSSSRYKALCDRKHWDLI